MTGVDIVIVSYECRDLLDACLSSIAEHACAVPLRVFVVDNGSTDGTPALVRERFPEVELIAAGRNLGFAAGSNLAIRRGSSPLVLLLNPDTRLRDGVLDRLLALLEERPEVGICGPRLELEDGTLDHAARRSFPTIVGALAHFTGVGRRGGAPERLAQYRAPGVESGPVDAVNGAFMLIRRRALDEVGLLDEGYWMYMEDLDLCYRFRQAGWLTWYEGGVSVVHVKAGSSGRYRRPRLNVAFHYGMYRFYRRHYAAQRSALVNAAVYGGIAVKLLVSILRAAVARRLRPA